MDIPDVRLTGDQQARLVAAQQQITTLKNLVRRAQMAGLDVAALDAKLAQAEKLRAGLLTHFGQGSTS